MNSNRSPCRHTGAGRYPVNKKPRSGRHLGFVRFAGCFSVLDTGLRRYDELMESLG